MAWIYVTTVRPVSRKWHKKTYPEQVDVRVSDRLEQGHNSCVGVDEEELGSPVITDDAVADNIVRGLWRNHANRVEGQ